MNLALAWASAFAFLALPPALLLARHRAGHRLPWWAIVPSVAFGGWLLLNAYVHFNFEHICEPFGDDMWSVPPELEDRFQRCIGDGGQRVFALFAGWVVALAYACPVFVVYGVGVWLRRRRATR